MRKNKEIAPRSMRYAYQAILLLAICFTYLGSPSVVADSVIVQDQVDIPEGAFNAKFIEDRDGISVIEFSGNYDRNVSPNQPNAAARAVVAREFYKNEADNYDFLVIFTGFDFDTDGATAFHQMVSNDVEGIGIPNFSNAGWFGSAGKLKGVIDMASLNNYDANALSARAITNSGAIGFDAGLKVLAHEMLHQLSLIHI